MPVDFHADFCAGPDVDERWGKLGHAFAEAVVAAAPRLRMRLRRIAPPGSRESAIVVPPEAVAEALRPHCALPDTTHFWVYNYRCRQCGFEGIPHGQRLLHDTHEGYEAVRRVHQGIKRPWKITRAVYMGTPERIIGRMSGHAMAITAAPLTALRGFNHVLLLPLRKDVDHEACAVALRATGIEHVIVAPPGVRPAAEAFLTEYRKIDTEAEDPEDPVEAERAEQRFRFASAARKARTALGKVKPTAPAAADPKT